MRVGIVTETYPPEVNGVAMTVGRLAEGLQSRGHHIHLVRPRQGGGDRPAAEASSLTTTLVRGIPLPGYSALQVGLPAGRTLRALWRREPPDALYVATEGLLGWSAVAVAAQLGIPALSGFHTNFHRYSRHYRIGFLRRPIYGYLRRLHNRTACTLVPTDELRTELLEDAFDRVEVLGRGVDGALFHPRRRSEQLRRAWGVREGERVVLYVGRLAAEKNLPLALRAFRAMRAADPALRFVLVGDGPMTAALQHEEEGLLFAGVQYGERLAEHYASADLFLFPSETETFGNVTLEAMASGLAPVAFDYAAARLLIEPGRNGLRVPPGDAEGFVQAAVGLVREPPERLAEMRAAARQRAEQHTWPQVVTRFETLLRARRSEREMV